MANLKPYSAVVVFQREEKHLIREKSELRTEVMVLSDAVSEMTMKQEHREHGAGSEPDRKGSCLVSGTRGESLGRSSRPRGDRGKVGEGRLISSI